jgi:P63C domain
VLGCAVLEDGTRVLSQRGVTGALGGRRGGSHWLRRRQGSNMPVFLSASNLAPYIAPSLRMALEEPIKYRPVKGSGSGTNGVNATLLPEICEVWLKARRDKALMPGQEHIARQAEVLMGGLATVGIIALVDEATGYQEIRNRHELNRILEAYIAKELLPWTKQFPDEFYQEMFRLRGWPYNPPSPKRPSYVGKLTNEIVYERLPPGVLDELRRRNPVQEDGRRRHKHHQLLTEDIGHAHLEKHIAGVVALERASGTWGGFVKLLNRAYPKPDTQIEMFDDEDEETT